MPSGPHQVRSGGRGDGGPPGHAAAPRHLDQRGGWLIAWVLLVGLTIVIFAGGLRGLAVDITVADDAVVGWLVGIQAPGLVRA